MVKKRIRILITTGIRGPIDERADRGEPIGVSLRAAPLRDVLDPDAEIVERGTPDSPVGHVEQYYQDTLVAPYFLRDAVEGEKEGFDAVIQECQCDPGVTAAREACDIPIVSSLESATHVAAMLGRKFSIIISSRHPYGEPKLHDLIAQYGLSSKLASIRGIDLPPTAFSEDKASPQEFERVKAIMLDAARKAIDEDGADVIVTYGESKMLEHLRANLEVPVLQGFQLAILIAEMFVKLGISQSKRSYPKPRHIPAYGAPERELLARSMRPSEWRTLPTRTLPTS
jgi:allantoin racemase